MIVLYVILGVILIVNILLLFPVTLEVTDGETFGATVKYLFFRFDLKKRKTEDKKKKPKAANKAKKTSKKSASKKKRPKISDIITEYRDIVFKLAKCAKKLLKRTVIKELNLRITVAEADAAETAVEYGLVCAAVYPALAATEGIFTLKKRDVAINTDFENHGSQISLFLKVGLRPVFAISALAGAVAAYIKFINNK